MPRPLRPSLLRSTGFALVAAASVALLAACTTGAATPTASAAPTTDPVTTAPGATAPATETAEPPTPFTIDCEALLTSEQLYEFNPNYGAAPDYAPEATNVVTAVEVDAGTACGYLNQTSGELIEISVATPTGAAGEQHRNDAAMTSKPVPTYGTPPEVEGYFVQAGGTGEAQVFHGPYWVVVDSSALFEPGDAQQLVEAVLGNLPAS